jgi:hypothetical protein
MPNDARYVGEPNTNLNFRQARIVPVVANPPRLNDQRKTDSRQKKVATPAMGIRPSGGQQTAPKRPKDNINIEKRLVPVSHISEAELDEWNPFSNMFNRNSNKFIPGDAVAYQITDKGIDLFYVRDGKILKTTRYDSRETLTQKMEDLKQKYIALNQQRRDLSINPKKTAMKVAQHFADTLNIKPNKIGMANKDIPIEYNPAVPSSSYNQGGNTSSTPTSSTPTSSTPTSSTPTSSTPTASTPTASTPAASAASPRPSFTPYTSSTSPRSFTAAAKTSPLGRNSAISTATPEKEEEITPERPRIRAQAGSRPYEPPTERPRIRAQAGSRPYKPENTGGMDGLLKAINSAKYNDKTLANMSAWQKEQAIRGAKIHSSRNVGESYPDTSFETADGPAHESRIGDMDWIGHMENPKKPDLNKEFAQFRDVDVEKVSESANNEINQMIRQTIKNMGLEEDFKKLTYRAKPKINNGKSAMHNPGSVGAVQKHGIGKLKGRAANGSQMENSLPRERRLWVA